jgi:uncharacterized protein (DUF1501 family)
MNRRNFLKTASLGIGLPVVLDGLHFNAYSSQNPLNNLLSILNTTDRVLVLIQLSGGNDGLNTVIPLDQYSTYDSLRSNISIPEGSAIKLNNSTGLHPSMTGIKTLFDEGKIALVQGVSYPNPNFSHFRATDIWNTASDYNQYLSSGWLGRYLNYEFPGFPDGYPNATMTDPPAIQIGSVTSLGFQGTSKSMAIAIQDPDTFYSLVSGSLGGNNDNAPLTPAGFELQYIRLVELQSQQYALQIKSAADKAKNLATYPSSNSLADQLKIVARLVAGGLKTRVYQVSLGGFDLHSNQVLSTDKTKGAHATLLGKLSDAIFSFIDDLKQLKVDNRVSGMTFSEFGRRVASNASAGTDHGTSEPVFIFGSNVKGGLFGNNPNLSDLVNGNLKMQYDFRQVYTSVMSQWFGIDQKELTTVIPSTFTPLNLFQTANNINNNKDKISPFELHQNYPNPFNSSTIIEYDILEPGDISLKIFDMKGVEILTLYKGFKNPGRYKIDFNASELSSGTYIYQLTCGSYKMFKKLTLIR